MVVVGFFYCVQPGNAAELRFETRLSVNETISNNVEFSPTAERRSGFATRVDPVINLSANGGRASLQLSYRIFHTELHEPVSRSETNSQLSANFSGALIPHKLYLRSNINYGDRSLRSLQLNEPDSLADSNRSKFGVYNITPSWYELIADQYAQRVTYQWTSTLGDEAFGPRNSKHNLSWRLSNEPTDSRLQWRLRARHAYDGDTGDLERRELLGGAAWYVNQDFAWIARLGEDHIDDSQVTTANNGSFWSAGFSWRLLRGLELGALVGAEDKQLQLSMNVSPRTSLVLGALDRESGLEGGARRYFGGFDHQARFTNFRSTYAENYVDGSGLSVSLLDPNSLGDDSIGRNDSVLFDLGDGRFLQLGVITGQVLERNWSNQLFYERRRNSLSASYQISRLVPLEGQAGQRSYQSALSGSRKHSRRWESQAFGQWTNAKTDGQATSELTFFGYSLNFLLNRQVRLGVQLDRRDLHQRGEADISETRLLGFATVNFGRGTSLSLDGNDGGAFGGTGVSGRHQPNHSDLDGVGNRRGTVDILLDDFSDFSLLQSDRTRNGGRNNSLFELDDELIDGGRSGGGFGGL